MNSSLQLPQSPLVAQYRRVWGLEHNEAFSNLTPFLPSTLLSRAAEAGKDIALLRKEPELLQLVVDEPQTPQISNVANNDELFIAAGDVEGNIKHIKNILERDYNSKFPVVLDELGASVLHYAAILPSSSRDTSSNAILEYLLSLESAADWVTHKNAAGMTPLMAACAVGSITAAELLLTKRSDELHVNATSAHGCSALHIAVDGGHEDLSLLLIKHGASVFSRASFCIDKSRAIRPPHVSAVLLEFGITPIELASLKQTKIEEFDFASTLIEASLLALGSGNKNPAASSASTPTASSRSRQPLRLLTAQKKRAIAQSLLAEGFSSAKIDEVRQLLVDMLGDASLFTDADLNDVVETLDTTSIHTSTVLSQSEDFQSENSSDATTRKNRRSPSEISNVQFFQQITGASFEEIRQLTLDAGAAASISTLGHLLLHSHHGTLPTCVRQLLSDFVASVEVSLETLQLVVELQPIFASIGSSKLSVNNSLSAKVIVFVSHDVRHASSQLRQRAALVITSAQGEEGVDFITFETSPSLLRSLCEVTDATPVNFDESLGYCCLTQSRDIVMPRICGVQSIIPFTSLFSDFSGLLFSAVATSRISPSSSSEPIIGGTYERKSDLLTLAIEAQADSFVSFFVSSPYAQLQQRHLVTAAQRGTATAFQIIFSAMGSAVSTLSAVDPVSGETPITAAIACGTCLHLTSMLQLASRSLQSVNSYGYSPLMVACLVGNESALLHLISLGANVNEVCPRGMTPLIAAIASSVDRMVMPLVQNGAFVSLPDANGLTPLRAAELFGSSAMFPLLHQHGDDVKSGQSHSQLPPIDARSETSPNASISDPEGTVAVVDDTPSSPSQVLSAMAAVSLDQIRSLEMYFAEIAESHLAPSTASNGKYESSDTRTSTSVVAFIRSTPLLPTGAVRIPIQAHNITVTTTHRGGEEKDFLPLYLNIEQMVKEIATVLKAMILDPHIVAEYVPLSDGDRSAILWLLSRLGTSVQTLVQRFLHHPPAEASTLLELETTFHEAQAAVHTAHRFVAVLHALHRIRVLNIRPITLCSVAEHPIWLRAVHALPTSSLGTDVDGVIAPLSLPTNLVLQALEATLPLVKDHPTVIKAIELLLDPHTSGVTTIFEFSFVHQILSEFSDEGLSSLHVLLGYHAVFLNGLPEVNKVWLRRAAPYDYVVVIGPVGVTILTNKTTTKTPLGSPSAITLASSIETRTYHNVASLLLLESSILRT